MDNNFLSPDTVIVPTEEQRVSDEIARLPEVELTEKLDASDLEELRRYFYPSNNDKELLERSEDVQRKDDGVGVPLTKEEFAKAVYNVIGNPKYDTAAKRLFTKLEDEGILSDGLLWWDDLLEVIIRGSAEAQLSGATPSKKIKEKRNILVCHCKSSIVRVLLVETPHSACYVVVSQLGNVGIYDQHMEVKVMYSVPLGKYKTSNCCWVTDAVYAMEANSIIIASSNRNLYFYNSSQIAHKLQFIITGTENIPTCLHYCTLGNKKAVLTFGDNKGDITSLFFHQPTKSFLQPLPDREATSYYWIQLKLQEAWVTIDVNKSVHGSSVNMVEYYPENKSVASCSSDPATSLVMSHKDGNQSSYIMKLNKGINRFHLDKRIGLLVTVSKDYSIKLWNPVVTKGPNEVLEGHVSRVVDVAILKHIHSIISISEDAVLKVWDMEGHNCIQTLHLHFPNDRGKTEQQRYLYPGIKHVASTDEIGIREAQSNWEKSLEAEDVSSNMMRNSWLRSEVVVVFGKYVKVLELESNNWISVAPLPLPRRNLEPAIPTPYYPLTHTFRENTKMLKQKMYKNLASLAPFYENSGVSTFDHHHEVSENTKTMKILVKNGVPHLALSLCKIKPLSRAFFKIPGTE
ncbi:Hypothetical protein NTJ_03261 [Nesidiocoris tenuis]|uniref:WD repeat-containing protein on Y chromosome n=1 Tax=Nesidiocoris tenuis TaxID=355587 RepID=A0ABN7AEJ0_9HEMI|nr:Hypothetical protein NTJ_03261 [Nesidiocoris tenuis]